MIDDISVSATCSVDACERAAKTRGLCSPHYQRLSRYGDPLAGGAPRSRILPDEPCSVAECERLVVARQVCSVHLRRLRRHGDPLAGGAFRQRRVRAMGSCSCPGCDRPSYRDQLCRRHHYRLVTHGSPDGGGPLRDTEHPALCQQPDCSQPYLAMGLCSAHYARRQEHGDPAYQRSVAKHQPCSVRGCAVLQLALGYCPKHYQRAAKHGDPEVSLRAEIGTGTVSSGGYRIVFRPGHPNANKHGRLPEHRLVMGQLLGRPLRDAENVHHINGNKLDNRPENLELWVKSQPCGQRVQDLVGWAREILERYGDYVDGVARGHAEDSSGR